MSLLSKIGQVAGDVENLPANTAKLLHPVKPHQSNLSKAATAILRASEKYRINPAYLWGIYGTETSYGSAIDVSSTGARGPFQFEPATAKEYGYPLGVNEHGITDWGAFSKQAEAAAHYLQAHGGTTNPRKAVEAYNPGEASYYGKVVEHAKSFSSSFATESENAQEARKENAPAPNNAGSGILKLGLEFMLLLIGAVLVLYGIMVAVRPRDSALALPKFAV